MSGAIERYAEKNGKRGIGTERAGHTIALNLLAAGFSCEKVAKYVNLPIEVVRTLAEQRKK